MRLFAASAFALTIGLLSVSAQSPSTSPAPPSPNIGDDNGLCNTPECKATADAILENLNPAADPCDDFYEFACGGFLQRKEIPQGQAEVSTFEYDRTENITRQILEADSKTLKGIDGKELDEASLRNLDKIQSLYKMCMNETRLESIGMLPLYNELQQLATTIFPVQGSPLALVFSNSTSNSSSSSSTSREALSSALAHFIQSEINTLVSISSGEDPVSDPTIQRIFVRESGLTLRRKEAYQVPAMSDAFRQAIAKTVSLVFNNDSRVDAAKWAQDVFDFEVRLANISTSSVDKNNYAKLFNTRTVRQLDQLNPAIDWPLLLEKLIGNATHQNDQNIIVTSPAFQERLGKLLEQTPPVTLQTYFAWKLIKNRGNWLSVKYREPLETLNAILSGVDPSKPPTRWKTCAGTASVYLGSLVGYFYVGLEFSASDRQATIDIINALKDSYRANFPHVDWLDNQTLANALRKLDAIEPQVGYSTVDPNVGSSTDLETYYAEAKILPGDYFGTMVITSQLDIRKNLDRAGKKVQRERMAFDPQTINAFYYPMSNQITFPAAFVQPPMFRSGAPEYINYGILGSVAGHEITHAFDNNGRLFDYDGFLRDWWTNETATQFTDKAQCIIDQYSQYTIPDPLTNTTLAINGVLTVSENIADNGGVKMAFNAWMTRYNTERTNSRQNTITNTTMNNQILPGLERWTRDQMFFLAYGQLWCSKATPQFEQQMLRSDPHAPSQWRVNGPLQNLPAFADAFKCLPSSPMAPAKRCAVW